MRPLLKPALRRLWRDPCTLQLGIDPRHAVALGGVDPGDTGLLDLIDGTRGTAELIAEATRRGHPPERARQLLDTLATAAALDDAPDQPSVDRRRQPDLLSLSLLHREPGAARRIMAGRDYAAVDVFGAGRVGAAVAMLLEAAGIGQLTISDPGRVRPADLAPGGVRGPAARHASRAAAARALLGDVAAGPLTAGGLTAGRHRTGPSEQIAVLAPAAGVVPPEWLRQVRHHPHLPVVIRETTALIGPLVLPGRTPCLRCVELVRGERDPVWPALAAQLVGEPAGVEPCDIALASAAASIVALHVLAWIDRGRDEPPPSVAGVVELSLADLRLRRRTVAAHPGCGCGAIDAPGAA